MEQAAGQFCQLGGSAGSSGNGCLQHQLEMAEGIRLPAFLPNPEMPGQNNEGPGGIDVTDSAVAVTALVPGRTGASLRTGPDSSEREFVGRTVGSTTPSIRVAPASRVEIIRSNFEAIGVSNQVVSFLLGGTRDSTCSFYQSAWNGWRDWNIRRGSDPLSPNVTDVLEFLSFLATNGKAYRTVNVYRSMLSSTLGKLDGVKIGKHPLVVRLLKGIYNHVPPTPKYTGFWDVSTVIRYLSSLGQNESLSFNDLSLKLTMLLALSSFCRISELAAIVRASIVVDGSQAKFTLSKPRKTQNGSPLQVICIERLVPASSVCPIGTLEAYLAVSERFRQGPKSANLLLGLRAPHHSIGTSSVGRWIKAVLSKAGVDTSTFSAHSTRGAAASNAAAGGVSTDVILRTGSWRSESTFSRFYRRQVETTSVASTLTG